MDIKGKAVLRANVIGAVRSAQFVRIVALASHLRTRTAPENWTLFDTRVSMIEVVELLLRAPEMLDQLVQALARVETFGTLTPALHARRFSPEHARIPPWTTSCLSRRPCS